MLREYDEFTEGNWVAKGGKVKRGKGGVGVQKAAPAAPGGNGGNQFGALMDDDWEDEEDLGVGDGLDDDDGFTEVGKKGKSKKGGSKKKKNKKKAAANVEV